MNSKNKYCQRICKHICSFYFKGRKCLAAKELAKPTQRRKEIFK